MFADNHNKKLNMSIPGLFVSFSFNCYISPLSANVTGNIIKGKIKVIGYDYYILKAKVDNQTLFKDYIGDSKGKFYSLELYIKILFKKEGINPSSSIIKGTARDFLDDIKPKPPSFMDQLWNKLGKQDDGFSKCLDGIF